MNERWSYDVPVDGISDKYLFRRDLVAAYDLYKDIDIGKDGLI